MNDLLIEVLMTLFHEAISQGDLEDLPPLQMLLDELEQLSLAKNQQDNRSKRRKISHRHYLASPSVDALRIYSADENEKLTPDCQSLLHTLVSSGNLSPKQRELIIGEVMNANIDVISLDQLKTAILLMLQRLAPDAKELALTKYFIPNIGNHVIH